MDKQDEIIEMLERIDTKLNFIGAAVGVRSRKLDPAVPDGPARKPVKGMILD